MCSIMLSKRSVCLLSLAFLLLFFFAANHSTALAQNQQPPVATPDPTLSALQATISAQQLKIDQLSEQVSLNDSKLQVTRDQINLDLDRKLLFAGVAASVLGLLGISSYRDLKKLYHERMQKTLQQNLYSLDPTFLPVYAPEVGFDDEVRRIKISGLKNIRRYHYLGKGTRQGVVIVSVCNPQEESLFVKFLKEENPNPEQAAYILYSPAQDHRIEKETFKKYLNLTAATNPTALARAILDVGRGLKPLNKS